MVEEWKSCSICVYACVIYAKILFDCFEYIKTRDFPFSLYLFYCWENYDKTLRKIIPTGIFLKNEDFFFFLILNNDTLM